MKKKDGWITICGYDCYVEDDMVVRCLAWDGATTAYPYKRAKDGSWTNAVPVKTGTLRNGLHRGTYSIK